MTLDKLIDGTLIQLQRDTDDLSLSEYSAALKLYINEGYRELLYASRPKRSARVTIQGGKLPLKALIPPESNDSLVSVTQVFAGDRRLEIASGDSPDTLHVGDYSGEVEVRYVYMPGELINGTDEPELPEWAHYALVNFATHKALLAGSPARQSRGIPFRNEFERVRYRLMDGSGEKRMLKN